MRRLVFLLLFLFVPTLGGAEIVMLGNGNWLKVDRFEIEGEEIRLWLRDGGQMVLGLDRIERILEEEMVPSADPDPIETPGFFAYFDPGRHTEVPSVPYGELIHAAAVKHGVNPTLVAAVVEAESDFRPAVRSHKGAQGLMQLMPATAARFGVHGSAVFEPAVNLDAGTRYLRWLLDRFDGALELALAGYNAGEGSVDRYDGVPPYRETIRYIRRIRGILGLVDSAPTTVASTSTSTATP
ncbi:MAG: lytic transglycosylase domain-containing protein [Acidobacteriota bacterium]